MHEEATTTTTTSVNKINNSSLINISNNNLSTTNITVAIVSTNTPHHHHHQHQQNLSPPNLQSSQAHLHELIPSSSSTAHIAHMHTQHVAILPGGQATKIIINNNSINRIPNTPTNLLATTKSTKAITNQTNQAQTATILTSPTTTDLINSVNNNKTNVIVSTGQVPGVESTSRSYQTTQLIIATTNALPIVTSSAPPQLTRLEPVASSSPTMCDEVCEVTTLQSVPTSTTIYSTTTDSVQSLAESSTTSQIAGPTSSASGSETPPNAVENVEFEVHDLESTDASGEGKFRTLITFSPYISKG